MIRSVYALFIVASAATALAAAAAEASAQAAAAAACCWQQDFIGLADKWINTNGQD